MKRVVDRLVDALAQINIDTYFIVTGGAIAPFVDAVSSKNYYCFQHEQAAVMAAEGYFRASGKIPVVLVTSGPGFQNVVNGVCGCWFDSIPCLVVSGQVNIEESLDKITSRPRQVGFQEMNIVGMISEFTKFATRITSLDSVPEVFSTALSSAFSGRMGPAVIDFPVNIQMMDFNEFYIKIQNDPVVYTQVPDVKTLLSNSQRPLVIIGNGARKSQKLVDWISVPFVTTWAAIDIISHDHPLRVGCHGVYGDRVSNYAIQNADLLVILGSRLDTRQTGGKLHLFSQHSKKIMVDIDEDEIHKLDERGIKIDVPIVGTVESFIEQVTVEPRKEWCDIINNWKKNFGIESTRKGNVYPFLSNLPLPDECIVIPDQGGNLIWTMQNIKVHSNIKVFTNLGNSSMGWALPAAIGAAIANKGVPIVCIEGDGGIQMNIQELLTIAKLGLPITIIILNNQGYGIMKQFQDSYFGGRYTATSSSDVYGKPEGVDFVEIARAYGIEAHRTLDVKISTQGPVLYDVPIDADQKIFPKLEFGNSLENMTPYMTHLHKHMIVEPTKPNTENGWVFVKE
jgi:acetolactate synthase-1/2/3 large subunit